MTTPAKQIANNIIQQASQTIPQLHHAQQTSNKLTDHHHHASLYVLGEGISIDVDLPTVHIGHARYYYPLTDKTLILNLNNPNWEQQLQKWLHHQAETTNPQP